MRAHAAQATGPNDAARNAQSTPVDHAETEGDVKPTMSTAL
jgi:hypothetical protein